MQASAAQRCTCDRGHDQGMIVEVVQVLFGMLLNDVELLFPEVYCGLSDNVALIQHLNR
jgi:hypothetical protein